MLIVLLVVVLLWLLMSGKFKGTQAIIGVLGILNIISGIFCLLLALSMFIIAAVLGILYFVSGVYVLSNSYKFKWVFYLVIIPLSIYCLFVVIQWNTQNIPDYYRLPLIAQIIFVTALLLTCIGNIVFLNPYLLKTSKPQAN